MKMARITIKLDHRTYQELKSQAQHYMVPVSSYVRMILIDWMDQQPDFRKKKKGHPFRRPLFF
jgi:hypothetical protein